MNANKVDQIGQSGYSPSIPIESANQVADNGNCSAGYQFSFKEGDEIPSKLKNEIESDLI